MLGQKANLSKMKRTKAIQSTFSHHDGVKLKLNNTNVTRKSPNNQKFNTTLLNNPWVKENPREKYIKLSENKNATHQSLQDTVKAAPSEIFGTKCSH